MRDKAPVRRSKWNPMSRSSTWLNVWYATRRPAACTALLIGIVQRATSELMQKQKGAA